ncbi:MAG: ATP-binding cassette domain-containing protein [Micropruina sp.]|uniref:metal ABC transporter ATP-binding protein n=1 Tax=Micropruina sp. TaxID=2737536 RepID=UPI0039E6F0C2
MTPASRPPAPAITADQVDVVLSGVPIVRSAGFAIGVGQTVAVTGNNGSGKTTLMRALLGLVPHRGTVQLFGTELGRFRDWRRIGYVPQRSTILVQQATAREVVASGRLGLRRPLWPASAADRRGVEDALARVGMADRAQAPFVRLSGGQQQRVLIARALAGEADLMIWDEPLAGVDQTTQSVLADVLRGLRDRGDTVVMVLHEPGPFEPLIDRAITLADGRVIADGPFLPAPGGHEVHELPHSRVHGTGLEVV